jgi:hypothetical protein
VQQLAATPAIDIRDDGVGAGARGERRVRRASSGGQSTRRCAQPSSSTSAAVD